MNHYTKHLNPFWSNSYKTQFFSMFSEKGPCAQERLWYSQTKA